MTANRLQHLRKENGYSQEVLAEKLGISRQSVSKWERAESSPEIDNLMALSKIYGLTIDELLDVSGDKVIVTPYSDAGSKQEGRITQINPLVDDKGMVKVKASVNGKGRLFSGMNERVNVHRSLGERLVIPKSAVVLRSGKQVVFTLKKGKAQWNYVQTGLENAENYSMADDALKEGDTVIVTGNVNLAHEAPVKVVGNGE